MEGFHAEWRYDLCFTHATLAAVNRADSRRWKIEEGGASGDYCVRQLWLNRILDMSEVKPKGSADGLEELRVADAHGNSVGCSQM